jgi:hypothetical protein
VKHILYVPYISFQWWIVISRRGTWDAGHSCGGGGSVHGSGGGKSERVRRVMSLRELCSPKDDGA